MPDAFADPAATSDTEEVETDRLLTDAVQRSPLTSASASASPDRAIQLSLHVHFTPRVCLYLAVLVVCITLGAAASVWLFGSQHLTPASVLAAANTTVASDSVSTSPSSTSLYSRWQAFCDSPLQNLVLHRDDAENYNGGEQERPWSVNNATFAAQPALPFCQSTQQLVDALHYGQRRPLPGSEFNTTGRPHARVEWERSVFEPAGCALRWHEGDEVCAVLDRYSHVVLAGDSLSRHVHQALFMLLTQDLRYGGLPRLSRQEGLFDRCQCDGQFSEHKVCREYEWFNMFNLTDPRLAGLCTHTQHYNFSLLTHTTYDGKYAEGTFQPLCSDDPRPRVIFIQGHAHFESNRGMTMDRFIRPLLDTVNSVHDKCAHRFVLHWVLTGAPAQSRLLDGKFPQQQRERVAAYNAEMDGEMQQRGIGTMHYWNMTLNAATSDGFHYLSDVNLLRASSMINYLQLLNASAS